MFMVGRDELILKNFADSFFEARKLFLNACNMAGYSVKSYKNILGSEILKKDLFTDVCIAGNLKSKKVLFVISGIHGVEGYAGSACQISLIESGELKSEPSKIVLIHAMNPFGFCCGRRANENNVDLNRNFHDFGHTVDFDSKYEDIRDIFCPKKMTYKTKMLFWTRILSFIMRRGIGRLQSSIQVGQYVDALGLFFGGKEKSWSNYTLHKILCEFGECAEKVLLVDLHSGLGGYGKAEMLVAEPEGSSMLEKSKDIWGDSVKSPLAGESSSTKIEGSVRGAIKKQFECVDLACGTLEVGTYPGVMVLFRLWEENCSYHFGVADEIRGSRERLKEIFCPEDERWRILYWGHFKKIINASLIELRSVNV
ncbi:MAG: hypothetical protein ACI86C_001696 [Candidatus Latescibacterota bacterium]|jgi:hypothetical protein